MWSIIFLCLLIGLFSILVVLSFSEKSVFNKKNVAFFLPLLVILFDLYYLGYSYAGYQITTLSFFDLLTAALKAFKFEVVRNYLDKLAQDDIIYHIDLFIAIPLAGLTLISGVLGFFKIGINNFFKVLIKSKRKTVDIAYGDMASAINYAKHYKNAVVWIDPRNTKLTSDDRKKMFEQNVAFINSVLTAKRLKLFNLFVKNNVHLICFQKNNEYLTNIYSCIDGLKENKKLYRFYVQGIGEYLSFIDEQLSIRCEKSSNVAASSFDIYELMSRKFADEHNLAKFLPREMFDHGTIKSEYKINVVMLGFGKTSYALFKSLILNNQFVEKDGNKYKVKPVNYYLFDKDNNSLKHSLVSFLKKYSEFTQSGLKPVDLPLNIFEKVVDIKADFEEEFIKRFKAEKNEFNFYFVCTRDDLENSAIANSLSRIIDLKRSVIFYNIDDVKSKINSTNPHVIPIGYKDVAMDHDLITNDELWHLSNLHNETYHRLKNEKENVLTRKPIIEKLSNAYAVINYKFKLNLIGFDLLKNDSGTVSKEEFLNVYDPDNKRADYKYEKYFEVNTRTAIAYQEHLRWAMFYLVHGFTIMDMKEVIFDEQTEKIIHKDVAMKKHACLVDYYALDELIKHEYSLLPDNYKGNKKSIDDVDCYRFDYQSLDNLYSSIQDLNYSVSKLDIK